MTTDERIERLAVVVETHDGQLDKVAVMLADTSKQIGSLAGTVESLAASVVAHDNQIEALIRRRRKPQVGKP
jgi:hypothetical protein